MKLYAHVVGGSVIEPLIASAYWDADDPSGNFKKGDEIPVAQRFTAAFVANLIDVTAISPQPQQGWVTADGGKSFAAPVAAPPSAEQIAATNTAMRDSLMQVANNATFGIADAYAAGLLDTSDSQTFKAWAAYKLALSKVDLTTANPSWPTQPVISVQAG
ncbi:tail fiber assembly protein [Paraburkholderia silviterrae]|uniref:Virus tail fiber assembly protein lambda gpK n=1 Tax=Paraburkholderia silviterrae TaxID=2528715 RepID=A0A4R5M9B6_9BURK|nr:tail fiber assembly protein [Paraburkholderia silviterrae]TDG23207.1 hypothetical protein EYW47_14840 [Paraburkholderia silviterrae]